MTSLKEIEEILQKLGFTPAGVDRLLRLITEYGNDQYTDGYQEGYTEANG